MNGKEWSQQNVDPKSQKMTAVDKSGDEKKNVWDGERTEDKKKQPSSPIRQKGG